ncbi:MAG: PD-(D/E)XK nuclease family transposase [Candidatus Magnetomorum sp.]|nr:PD-(D/E)XK nuclease family transposase [Candidatus Magnetomorum sp.]
MNTQKVIRFDWAIKTILRDKANFDVLEGFLSALLLDDITVVQLIESESNQESDHQKYNRVDIMVLDGKRQHLIIEIQNERESDYLERLLFGTSKVIVENTKIGEPFKTIKKVISISIMYFNLGRGDDYIYYGSTQFRGLNTKNPLIVKRKVELPEKKFVFKDRNIEKEIFPEYYLIHVEKFKDQINSDIDEWIYMLKNEEIPDSFKSRHIDKARQKLKVQTMSDAERKSYERYLINFAIEKDMIDTARDEGEIKGRKEGEIKGRKVGLQQGEIKGEIKTYQHLLKNQNLPDDMIRHFEQKISDLQNQLEQIKKTTFVKPSTSSL